MPPTTLCLVFPVRVATTIVTFYARPSFKHSMSHLNIHAYMPYITCLLAYVSYIPISGHAFTHVSVRKHAYMYISKPHACMQTYMHATHVNAYMCTRTQIQSQGAVCVCVHIVVFTAVCIRTFSCVRASLDTQTSLLIHTHVSSNICWYMRTHISF